MTLEMIPTKGSMPSIFIALLLLSSRPWLAISRSTVRFLPGFNGPLPFHLETGYVGVGESEAYQLFYAFVESENDPSEDPLVLWLSGGPTCSGLQAFFNQFGPLQFQKDLNGTLPKLKLRQYSWTKVSSIIFLETPVGTGYSYSTALSDNNNGDTSSSKLAAEFLRKWMRDHPKFLSNPLYIGGTSYAGKTLPVTFREVANGNDAGLKPFLNLKGYFLGNPLTDEKFDVGSVVQYLHGMAIISDELYKSAKQNCKDDFMDLDNPKSHKPKCAKDLEKVNECISGLFRKHILQPKCTQADPQKLERTTGLSISLLNSGRLLLPRDLSPMWCWDYRYGLPGLWANDQSVRNALHIREGTVQTWKRCNRGQPYLRDVQSTIPYHLNLTNRGYRALIYSGDHDSIATFVGTQAWIRTLNYTIVDDWRPWTVDGQVGGYTRTYSNNFTFATVKGAGHVAPEDNPKECYTLFRRWISNELL